MNSIKSNKLLLDIIFEKNFKQVNIEKLVDNNKVDRIFYFDGDNNERILKERKGSEFLKSSNFYYFFF